MSQNPDTVAIDSKVYLAAEIVAAYVKNNPLPAQYVSTLLVSVHGALVGLGQPAAIVEETPEVNRPSPTEIRKSITPDAIVSFIDGKHYKTLKRHLGVHGLQPHTYRQRYGLPADYPMVAPSYAAQRSALAKSFGLGVPGGRAPAETAQAA